MKTDEAVITPLPTNGKHEPTPATDEAKAMLIQAAQAVASMTDEDRALASFKPDDAGNAEAFEWAHGQDYAYTTALGWLRWTGTHWQADDTDARLAIAMKNLLRRRQAAAALAENQKVLMASRPNTGRINAAIEHLGALLRANAADFDTHPHLLNVRNGVVNLRTGEIAPHDRTLKLTHLVDVDYDSNAEKEWIDGYLQASVKGGEPVVRWLQTWMGYCITGEKHIEQMLFAWGKPRAGKGTFFEAVAALMGSQLAKQISFATFAEKREPDSQNFDLAGLKAARLVIADESPRAGARSPLDVEKIKRITGGAAVRCAHKHRDFFEYVPRFKIAIISNFPLNADPDDDAGWHRVNIVEFPNSHLGNEDVSIKANFKLEHIQRALLAWLVDGAKAMYAMGNAATLSPVSMSEDRQAQRNLLDNVGQWLDECTAADPAAFVTNAQIRTSYEQWCKDNGHMPRGMKSLSQSLQRRGYQVGQQKKNRQAQSQGS
jgi:putative DNA primase/helicase